MMRRVRTHVRRGLAWAACLVVGAGVAIAAPGQQTPPSPPPSDPPASPPAAQPVDLSQIEPLIAPLVEKEAAGALDEVEKARLALLKQAQSHLQTLATLQAESQQLLELARTAPDRAAAIQTEIAAPIESAVPAVDPALTAEDITARLETARHALDAARTQRTAVEGDLARRTQRLGALATESAEAINRLAELRSRLGAGGDPNDPPPVAEARRLALLAEIRLVEGLIAKLDAEGRSYEARKTVMPLRVQQADRNVVIAERTIRALEEALNRKRAEAAEAARRQAEAEQRAAAFQHPLVQHIVARNTELATRVAELTTTITEATAERQQLERLLQTWRESYRKSREQAEVAGLSDTIGLHLRNQRSRLPDARAHQRATVIRQKSLRELQLESNQYHDALNDLVELDAALDARIAQADPPVAPERLDLVRVAAREAMVRQQETLARLVGTLDDYVDTTLPELQRLERELIALVIEYRAFIDERILWIQSREVVQMKDLRLSWEAMKWFARPDAWRETAQLLWTDARQYPLVYLSTILLLAALFVSRTRLARQFDVLAEKVRKPTTDRFTWTFAAAVLTPVLAAIGPLALAIVAWRLTSGTVQSGFGAALASGLRGVAILLFGTEVLRILCRPDGVGDAHLGWRADSLRLVRHHLRWLVLIAMPAAFVIGVADAAEERAREPLEALSRLAFALALLGGAVFAHRVFHPDRGVLRDVIARYRGGWIDRLQTLWFWGLVLAPAALAAASLVGWHYTALQLESRLLSSAILVLTIVTAHAMFMRWLTLTQRRIAIEQWRRKRAAMAEQAAAPSAETGEIASAAPQEEGIDVAAVSEQSKRLLGVAAVFALVIGLAWVWAEVMPAFRILDTIVIWHDSRTVTDADGISSIIAADITLTHLAIALIIFIVTYAVSRNIPGLLEITILQRLPLTPSARYAVTTLVRYVIVIVGVVLGFNAVGIGWSKVQWLAAAITFGLGFGLQEIFANFVSGIIILFERPIRVGDVVTVGDVSGVVSKIRMRATTITDWDRKELIIPNKEFVTGRVMNWTLSDSTLRVRITVGIAYGSDTEKAKQVLLDMAARNPLVLRDPPPRALFIGFGASSLDFELRCFVASVDHNMQVRDELNMAIDRAFREQGVEIAFPQQDIHIRSVDAPIPLQRVGRDQSDQEPPSVEPPREA